MTRIEGTAADQPDAASKVAAVLLDLIAKIPESDEVEHKDARSVARSKVKAAATKAALTAGGLALPPGPAGWLTILPEMYAVWRIQAKLVADIAAIHGKKASLGREQMLYCLFRHTASQAVRDLVVRVGERSLVKRASLRMLQSIAERVGIKLTQRAIGKSLSRWLPIVGAVGVGGYAFYDTMRVGSTATEFFASNVEVVASDDA